MLRKIISYSSIIHAIERIYIKISLTILHRRVNTYHKKTQLSEKSDNNDIKPTLIECIDEIIDTEHIEHLHAVDYSLLSNSATTPYVHLQYPALKPHVVNKNNVGELSKYFKARNNGSDLHPDIMEKLEHSTWEHLHTAVRYARQHENKNAKMHVDIACSACKELSHYMPEEQYKVFVTEIEKHMDALKSDIKVDVASAV